MFPKRFGHWLATNQFCSRICWWRFAKYRARYMSRSMLGTALAGQRVTVTAPPGVNNYTQMERAVGCLGRKLLPLRTCAHIHTSRHTQLNTDQENVVHQRHKRGNYGLLWLKGSKVKKCYSIIWAAKLWHWLIWLFWMETSSESKCFKIVFKLR